MAWEFIEEQTLTSAAASVVFDSGLTAYKFFRLTCYVVNDAASQVIYVRFNNDSGGNYAVQRVIANNTTVSGSRITGQTQVESSGSLTTGNFASASFLVAKPSASVKAQVTLQSGVEASPVLTLRGAEWDNTADLIDQIDVFPNTGNFGAGTSILLEGLAL